MKKSRLPALVLSLILLVCLAVSTAITVSAVGGAVTSGDWIASPKKTLVKCPGGDCDHKTCDYVYSFAVVGDTQNLNYIDVNEKKTNMNSLYQWLVENQEKKNIQYVMGVGDITQSWHRGYSQLYPEWINAAEAVSLLDGKIDYSLVRGNHDFSDAKDGFNGVFGVGDKQVGVYDEDGNLVLDNQYYENLLALSLEKDAEGRPMAGFRIDGKIEETYRKVTMGGHKYIIFTLDWHPSSKETDCVTNAADLCTEEKYCITHYSNRSQTCEKDSANCKEVTGCKQHNSYVNGNAFCTTKLCEKDCTLHDTFGWLDNLLTQNSDYSAIITLHSFITRDGTIIDDFEDTFPHENVNNTSSTGWYEVSVTGGNANPKDLWMDVLYNHANVKMIFCGHIDEDNIITTQLRGKNGNTVTCSLIDGQTIDSQNEPAGLVAMYYISADGKVANVEYISTVRATAKQPAFLRDVNQFKVTLDYSSKGDDGWTETAHGDILTNIYEAHPFHILIDDDSDESTNAVYLSSHDTWEDTLTALHSFSENGDIHNAAKRRQKTYYIVMADDYTDTYEGIHNTRSVYNVSKTVLDLNKKTLTLASAAAKDNVFLPFYTTSSGKAPNYAITNGNIDITGSVYLTVTQTSAYGNGTVGTLELSDLTITYKTAAGVSAKPLVSYYSGADNCSAQINLNVNNCNIDFSNVSGAFTLFNLKDKYNNNNVNLTFNGGSVKGNTAENTTLFTENLPGDKITFSKDTDGNYTDFIFSDNTQLGGVFYSEENDKYLEFGTPVASSGKYAYNLTKSDSILTKYGPIPTIYQNTETYPFVLFKDGEAIGITDWANFIDGKIDKTTSTRYNESLRSGCTLLLRRHYSTSEASSSPSYFAYIDDITIDLGNHVFTRGSCHLFQPYGTESVAHSTKITVTNGTLKTEGAHALIVYNNNTNNTARDQFDFIFDGITLDLSKTTENGAIVVYTGGVDEGGIGSTVTLNNCTINLGTAIMKNSTIFSLADNGSVNRNDIAVKINGGTLAADNLDAITKNAIASFNAERESGKGSPDSLTLGQGANGKYLTVKLPVKCEAPKAKYTFSDGNYMLTKTSEDGEFAYYDFVNVSTPYGDISYEYLNPNDYPFVVFKNGEVIHAFKNWTEFIDGKEGVGGVRYNSDYRSGCTLLLRRDYSTSENTANPSYFAYITDMNIDLGGFTFTRGTYHMFQIFGTQSTAYSTKIKIYNGTIASKEGLAPVCFNNNKNNSAVDHFDITFEDVNFGVNYTSIGIVSCFKDGTSQGITATITLNDCTINYGASTSKVTLFALAESANTEGPQNKCDVDIIINGGSIIADNMANLTLATLSDERDGVVPDSVSFGKGSDGDNVVVRINKSNTAPADKFAALDDRFELVKKSEEGNYAYYELKEIGEVEPGPGEGSGSGEPEIDPDNFFVEGYGIVPIEHKSATFLVFLKSKGSSEYTFNSSYSTFKTAINGAKALAKDTADQMAVVMQASYALVSGENTNIKSSLGTITVDLKEHTLSTNSDKHVFDDHINYVNDSAFAAFETTVIFKNGTIRNDRESKKPFVAIGHVGTYKNADGSNGSAKQFNFEFDNVTFCGSSNVMLKGWDHGSADTSVEYLGVKIDVKATNCTFDFTSSATSTAVFTFAGNYPHTVVDVELSGCTAKASDLSKFNIYTKGKEDTLTIDTSKDFTLIQTTSAAPTFTYTDSNDVKYGFAPVSNNGNYTYKLAKETNLEGYGISIPADKLGYFLVLLEGSEESGYTAVGYYSDIAGALGNVSGKDYTLVLRSDYTKTTKKYIGNFTGSLTIDLGGHTLTVTEDGNYLLDLGVGVSTGPQGAFNIKNGTLVKAGGRGFVCFNYDSNLHTNDAAYTFNFDGVTFISNYSKYNKNVIFATWEDAYDTAAAKIVVNSEFNNCTFDYKNSISDAVMLDLGHSTGIRDRVQHHVTVNGGTIIANNAANINTSFAKLDGNENGRADSIKFGVNENGEGTKLVLPASVASSSVTAKWNTAGGSECVFIKVSEKEENNEYKLFVETKYGNIPLNYSDTSTYPIVLFLADKTFVGGYSATANAIAAAGLVSGGSGSVVGGADCVILLRNNCNIGNANNVTGYKNNVTIDLGGYTLTSTTACFMTLTNSATESADKTYGTITIKNGSFLYTGGGTASSIIRANGAEGIYTINFEDIKISTTNTQSTNKLYLVISTSGSSKAAQVVNSTFTSCVFDYTKAQAICYFFGSGGGASINANLADCKVLAGDNNELAYIDTSNDKQALAYYSGATNDTLNIVKTIELVLDKGVEAPSKNNVWKNADGIECVFVKTGESDEYVNYSLYPTALIGYKVKSSVTLHSGLVYNIYIPTANLSGFTVNGNSHEYEAVELDGVEYYKVSVDLPAKEALSDINLKVNLKSGEGEVSASWTLSLVKYAEKVIGDTNAAEAKLVSDILSYARAAYDYFGVSDAEKTSKVNALLGENYDENNAPVMNGSADVPTVGLKSATFVLNATPAVRFYLADGADASKYTFFADGKKLDFTEGSDSNGAYVEISVYAYLMGKTVEYRIDGAIAGSYHINSYYSYAKTLNDEKLVTLVERFAKYCESAEEYRLSVIGTEN